MSRRTYKNISKSKKLKLSFVFVLLAGWFFSMATIPVSALSPCSGSRSLSCQALRTQKVMAANVCGGGPIDPNKPSGPAYTSVHTSINIGCTGEGNAIEDMFLAVVRFLSVGVGVVVVASVIVAGIQFTVSRGDPQATAKALNRIATTGAALLLYIFAFALLNFLVPGGLFK